MATTEIDSARPVSATYELLRRRLERNRDEREQQLEQLSSEVPDNALDVVAAAYRASVERLLSETQVALRRMDDHTYGRCESCGATIPLERLELVPHASCCVGCARRWVRDR